MDPAVEGVVPETVALEVPPNAPLRFAVRSPVPNETQDLDVGLGQQRPEQVCAQKAGGAGKQDAPRGWRVPWSGGRADVERQHAVGAHQGTLVVGIGFPRAPLAILQDADQRIEARVAG